MSKIPQIMIFSNNLTITKYEKDFSKHSFPSKDRIKKLKRRR